MDFFGAFFFGSTMAVSTVLLPLVVKGVFGTKGYKDLLPFCSVVTPLGNAIITLCIGYIVDGMGPEKGYPVCFIIGGSIVIVESILFIISIRGGRRLVTGKAEKTVSA